MKYDDNLVIVRSVINNGIIFVSIFILSTCDDKHNTRVPTCKIYLMCIICTIRINFHFIPFEEIKLLCDLMKTEYKILYNQL